MAIVENNILEITDVLPTSFPLAISLVVQNEIVDSIMIPYPINPKIKCHNPKSLVDKPLVNNTVKINAVNIEIIETAKAIKPVYPTRISDNLYCFIILICLINVKNLLLY